MLSTEVTTMAQLIVRNLEAAVKSGLERRAALHGRSMEAEVREILRDAVFQEESEIIGLGTQIANLFRGIGFESESEIPRLGGKIFEPVEFEP
jgi:plasmid stability protein